MYIHVPDAVLNAFSTYVQNGFSSVGQIFQAQNQSELLIFQFSELIDIDVVVFNNHSQVYLYKYVPIEVYISGNISVINEQTGDVISSIICYGSTQVSAVLPSNQFAVMFRISLALCSPADISAVRFRYDFFALNEVGTPLSFYAQSASFSVKRLPVFSLILSQFPFSNATPASTVLSPLEITLSSSIDYCSIMNHAAASNGGDSSRAHKTNANDERCVEAIPVSAIRSEGGTVGCKWHCCCSFGAS
jgi:hypothetical protein